MLDYLNYIIIGLILFTIIYYNYIFEYYISVKLENHLFICYSLLPDIENVIKKKLDLGKNVNIFDKYNFKKFSYTLKCNLKLGLMNIYISLDDLLNDNLDIKKSNSINILNHSLYDLINNIDYKYKKKLKDKLVFINDNIIQNTISIFINSLKNNIIYKNKKEEIIDILDSIEIIKNNKIIIKSNSNNIPYLNLNFSSKSNEIVNIIYENIINIINNKEIYKKFILFILIIYFILFILLIIKIAYPNLNSVILKIFYIICCIILGLFNSIFVVLFYFNNNSILKFLNIKKEFKEEKSNFNIIIEDLLKIDKWCIILFIISFLVILKIV